MGTRGAFLFLGVLLASLACVWVGAGESTEYPSPSRPGFCLITDYLPVAIYERDSVVGCFRVENTTGAEAKLELVATAYDEKGQTISERTQAFSAPATGFGQVQGTQNSGGCAKIVFLVRKGTDVLGSSTVRLLRETESWPATQVRAGRLWAGDTSELVIPMVVRRAKREEDRAFAAVKWLLKASDQGAGRGGKTLIFVPGRWRLKGAEPADASKASGKAGADEAMLALGPYEPNGAPPILCAVSQILNVLYGTPDTAGKAWSQALIFLPPEDLDVATDPRVYRVLVEALLTHVESLQSGKVLLVPPFHYGAPAKCCESLWREVNSAASACGVSTVDPAEYLEEKLWRADPAVEGVYGIRPNAEGLKKIEQGLLNLVR